MPSPAAPPHAGDDIAVRGQGRRLDLAAAEVHAESKHGRDIARPRHQVGHEIHRPVVARGVVGLGRLPGRVAHPHPGTAAQLLFKCGAIKSAYFLHYRRFLHEQFPKGVAFPALEAPKLPRDLPIIPKAFEPRLKLIGKPQFAGEAELARTLLAKDFVVP